MTFLPSNPDPTSESDPALLDRILVGAFLENVPDLVYFKDRDSRFIAVSRSKAARHGLAPADLVGKSDADFFSEQHAQWARADEEGIVNTGEAIIGKLERLVWADGHLGWAQSTKMPLRDENGAIIGTFGLSRDVTRDQETQLALEQTKRNLVEASHCAGMAEVATGVLHNIGNVLTSLNVSASVIETSLQQSKAESLAKLAALLESHAGDLGAFIANDPKGRRVPEFLESLARHALEEREKLLGELASLQENVDHIKEIVTMQQAYATTVGVTEVLDASLLMEDALRMNAGALVRHAVSVVRDYQAAPAVVAEKAKVLQILINFVRNAKYACDAGGAADKLIMLRVEPTGTGHVRLIVQDSGVGIPPENLARIFTHGFTTRADGHGFGLHSSVVAAQEMKGSVTAQSEGHNRGATFTLELPVAPADAIPANAYCPVAP
ncbi:MAG: ATP-binding protein [Opitutaceae bacterium]